MKTATEFKPKIPAWASRVPSHSMTPTCADCKTDYGSKVSVMLTGMFVDPTVPIDHADRAVRFQGQTHLCFGCLASRIGVGR